MTMCLFPTPSVLPAAAASDAVRWTKVNTPTEGEAGDWALAAGSDIRLLTMSSDGTLYAAVNGLTYSLYQSADGGYSWEHAGNVRDEIAGIAIARDTGAIYYATASAIYRSANGGRTFEALPPHPGGAGTDNIEITSIDVARTNGNIIVVGTRDSDSGEFGGVYILDETAIIPTWQDSGLGGCDITTVAFSPDYSSGRRMVAVATDEDDTYITTKIGNTGWSEEIGYAGLNVPAASAVIAFPDIDGIDFIPEEFLCFVAIETGTGEGDVYRIDGAPAPGESTATDLNAGLNYGRGDIDITGLAVYSDDATLVLLAGAAEDSMTYTSADGGETWTRSRKAPTGESRTGVLIPPDFSATGRMYAFNGGEDSALSVSRDNGTTWNQVGLIDTTLDSIIDVAPSPRYDEDTTLFMLTFGSGPYSQGLWRTADGSGTWERTLSGRSDAVDSLKKVAVPPEYGDGCRTVFVAGESRGSPAIWESTDNGQSYRRRFMRDPTSNAPLAVDAWAIADKTTLLIGSYDGSQALVYRTGNSGSFFDAGMPAGNQPLHTITLSPDYARDGIVLAGNTAGWVYLADNTSASFEPVTGDGASPPLDGLVTVAFDPAFSNNNIVHASGDSADGGIYRFEIGAGVEWESIDGSLPDGAMLNGLVVARDGVLYAVNSAAAGGIERSLNPTYASGPTFETMTRGLGSSATLYGLWQAGHHLWTVDTAGTRLMTLLDTLTSPPVPLFPDVGASAIGEIIDHTVRDISLDWETMEGASSFEWECGYDDDFASVSGKFTDSTSGTSVRLPALEPATTYHWRVRAGGPVLSPWSERRSFTTVMDTEAVILRPESPAAGATGVAVKPVFQWTAIIGAQAYELIVSTHAEMNNPVIAMTDEYALTGNVWQSEVSLDYSTTYYWKVRATGDGTRSEWSTIGVFTTEPAPPVETEEETSEAVFDHEETSLPEGTVAALAVNPTPAVKEPMPTPASTVDGFKMPDLGELSGVPDWIIYLVGILLCIVILSLTVILVIVLKIKRIP